MTTVEDRTRAAMDAITGLVEDVPPLTLPPPPGAASRSRRRWGVPPPGRRWGAWLAPIAAAAAVLAVAVTLVAVRDMPGPRPAPVISPAGPPVSFPQYYLTFDQPPGDTTIPVGLVLKETLTGKTLATLRPPRYLSFSGITGAADDRTFVAAAHRDPYGVGGSGARSRTWYLVRIVGSGDRASLTMTKLPIPATPPGTVVPTIALSPDATMLAVVTMPYTDFADRIKQVLRVYSVATGAVLHTWSTGFHEAPLGGGSRNGGDPNAWLAWIGEHALAYNLGEYVKSGMASGMALDVLVLDLSRPDGNLLASSRTVMVPPENYDKRAPFGCGSFWGDVMITGDGKSYVCGGEGVSSAKLPTLRCYKGPAWNTVAFVGISLTTKQPASFLSGYKTACFGAALQSPYPLWVNATGSTLIGYIYLGGGRQMFGVFSRGSFKPLPIPVSGSLLNQVAWLSRQDNPTQRRLVALDSRTGTDALGAPDEGMDSAGNRRHGGDDAHGLDGDRRGRAERRSGCRGGARFPARGAEVLHGTAGGR